MLIRLRILTTTVLSALTMTAAAAVSAQSMTVEQARAIVAPLYDALNVMPGRDAQAQVLAATAPEWVSCGGNDACSPREKAAATIGGFGKVVPDLRWEIKEVLVAGDRIVVRGEGSGTPAGQFMGVPHGGRSFKVMAIDIHLARDGKLARTWHVEDWMGATRQLAPK